MMQTTGVFVTKVTDALFHFHFNKCWLLNSITVYNDLEEFTNSKHEKKLACFQMPYPFDPAFDSTVRDLLDHCDHILILTSELHDRTIEFVQRNDHKKISYFICGDFNWELEHSPVHKFYDWFSTTVHFYKFVRPELLQIRLAPFTAKPKMFDVLLGRKKLHRDLVYQDVSTEQNIVTYINSVTFTATDDFKDPKKWIWEQHGTEIIDPVNWTVDKVSYYGHRMSLSQVIPLEVYSQTAYSLVAETNCNNSYSFYTEKTVKPILACRLFLLISGQYALRNLKNIGFKSFDNVIDEDYDSEPGLVERCKMITEQVRYLSSIPQQEVLEKIRPICEHNFAHMMRTDWYTQYFMPAFVAYFSQT
jgi:hypothetical protein